MPAKIMRAATLLVGLMQAPSSLAQDNGFTIAFREDTPPFSQSVDGGYGGYIADICKEALSRIDSKHVIQTRPVSAKDRFKVIDDGDASVLCGPVSITADRLGDYVYSLPIFVSGISYATIVDQQSILLDPTQARAAVLRNTTAFSGSSKELFSEYFGVAGNMIFRDLQTLRQAGQNSNDETKNLLLVNGYTEGFDRLCDGTVKYMLGDVDILNSFSLRADCEPVVVRRTLTRELYAILFSKDFVQTDQGMKFYRSFQAAVFEQFQDGTIQEAFETNFPDQVMSSELHNLLTLYVRNTVE